MRKAFDPESTRLQEVNQICCAAGRVFFFFFSLLQAAKLTCEAQTAPSDRAEALKHSMFWMNKKESRKVLAMGFMIFMLLLVFAQRTLSVKWFDQ